MTGKENQLKKENQQLRNEIEDLKKQLDKLTEEIGHSLRKLDIDVKKSIMMLTLNMAATLWAKNDQLSLFRLNAMILKRLKSTH